MIIRSASGRAEFQPDKMGKADLVRGDHLFAGLNAFEPGQCHEPHAHCRRDKLYVVLEGSGEVTIGDQTSKIAPGDVALAPSDVVHGLRNPGPERLVVMVVMGPPPSAETGCQD
jgi:mannose-6-phosphate isomerase-like protein (cupin superfamily)